MRRCEQHDACSFFKSELKNMPPMSTKLKEWFCERDKSLCARYMVNQKLIDGFRPTSDDTMSLIETSVKQMHPNDYAKADVMLSSLKKN